MSFMSGPSAPPPPPPPPAAPILANPNAQSAGARARKAAAEAGGAGYNDTLKTAPVGTESPSTTGGKAKLGD